MMLAALRPQAEAMARQWLANASDAELDEAARQALALHPNVRQIAARIVAMPQT